MLRIIRWSLLAAYLLTVGLWPAAAAPVALACTGLAAIVALIPGPAWLGLGAIAWLKHRPVPVSVVAE